MRGFKRNNAAVIFGRKTAFLFSVALVCSATHAAETSFTAGVVMQKMDAKERYAFVAGIVEGLAMARYKSDGKKPEGMKCIYDWFYKNPDTIKTVYTAFEKYPEYPPGTVVDVLTRKSCGG